MITSKPNNNMVLNDLLLKAQLSKITASGSYASIYSPMTSNNLGLSPQITDNILIWGKQDNFINPTTENPVRIQDFLKHLDLSKITPVLEEMYNNDYRFIYPPEAVLKTMIYFKLKHRFLSEVFNDLKTDPELADNLGFDKIPNYKQLYHFLNYRLNSKGTKKLIDAFTIAIKEEYVKYGKTLGEELVIDATPLKAKPKDKDAQYNGHYKMKGYLWHNLRCLETGIPITIHVTHANEDEGHFLAPLLMKARLLGIEFKKIYFDCGYASLKNIARVKEFFNADIYSNIAENWIYRTDGTFNEIEKRYHKLWMEPQWNPHVDFDYKCFNLIMADKGEQVGAMYRNDILAEYEEASDSYMDCYHLRNRIEGGFGTEKRQTEIKNFNGKGIEKFSAHVGMHTIAIQALALCRLQNGVSEGLINLGGLI